MTNRYKQTLEGLLSEADIAFGGTRPHDIRVHNEHFYRRFLADGRLGLGESYMDGWWDCESLDEMFYRLFRSSTKLQVQTKNLKFMLSLLSAKIMPQGSEKRSINVGRKHYDLGNDLFSAMLDKEMIYTCGVWDNAANLDEAQVAKLDLICKRLKLQPGMTVLDVGCGWGGFAKHAAQHYGVRVVGISVSKEQLELARERCKGLNVEFRLQDYRHVPEHEKYDRIVSIEMFEHVGLEYYSAFMKKMRACLKDDGIFILQTAIINVSHYSNLWLTTYIFPGGYIPSPAEIYPSMEWVFVPEAVYSMGHDYYPTFMAWHKNFAGNWDKLKDRYDDRFYRMWSYFLLSTAAGFRARRAQIWQFVLTPNGIEGGYKG